MGGGFELGQRSENTVTMEAANGSHCKVPFPPRKNVGDV